MAQLTPDGRNPSGGFERARSVPCDHAMEHLKVPFLFVLNSIQFGTLGGSPPACSTGAHHLITADLLEITAE